MSRCPARSTFVYRLSFSREGDRESEENNIRILEGRSENRRTRADPLGYVRDPDLNLVEISVPVVILLVFLFDPKEASMAGITHTAADAPIEDRAEQQLRYHRRSPGEPATDSDAEGPNPSYGRDAQTAEPEIATDRVVEDAEAGLGGGLDQAEEAQQGRTDEDREASPHQNAENADPVLLEQRDQRLGSSRSRVSIRTSISVDFTEAVPNTR